MRRQTRKNLSSAPRAANDGRWLLTELSKETGVIATTSLHLFRETRTKQAPYKVFERGLFQPRSGRPGSVVLSRAFSWNPKGRPAAEQRRPTAGRRAVSAPPNLHTPVMLEEALSFLSPKPGQTIADVTAGCGGYSLAIRERLQGRGLLIASDRDPEMAAVTRDRLRETPGAPFRVFVARFSELDEMLAKAGVEQVDGLTADFGIASPHVDSPERGFSMRSDGPLSMQMDPDTGLTAEEVVNRWPEKELARLFHTLGEERFSRRIARRICEARRAEPIRSTLQLSDLICRVVPGGRRKRHPARKCFQAIRMACNREIEEIEALLDRLPGVLRPSGRAVCVAYHSIEDRAVKRAFQRGRAAGAYEILTRKVVRPSQEETRRNPRARSARLRCVERLEAES